jgi:hypothetical protein
MSAMSIHTHTTYICAQDDPYLLVYVVARLLVSQGLVHVPEIDLLHGREVAAQALHLQLGHFHLCGVSVSVCISFE